MTDPTTVPQELPKGEIAAALAAAQGKMAAPARNREVEVQTKTGASYSFRYATLDAIIDSIRKPLADNGLAWTQTPVLGGLPVMVTRLIHTSGQSLESRCPIVVGDHAGPQGWGSAITYARRYGLSVLLGIAADEDDDANAAEGNQVKTAKKTARKPRQPPADSPACPNCGKPLTFYRKTGKWECWKSNGGCERKYEDADGVPVFPKDDTPAEAVAAGSDLPF